MVSVMRFILLDRIAQAGLEPYGNVMPTHLVLALRTVVELHKNHGESWSPNGELRPTSNTCEECGLEFPYPCPTIQAIEKELGVNQ